MTNEINPVLEGDYLPADKFSSALAHPPIEISGSTEPADVIRTTQGVRLQILAHRLRTGISEDAKELNLDLQLLRDLDTAALTTRKIDVEERAVNESERVSEQTNALLKMLNGRNPFAVDLKSGELRQDLVGRSREVALPEAVLVPGHTRQGTEQLAYGDFVDDPDAEESEVPEDEDDDDVA